MKKNKPKHTKLEIRYNKNSYSHMKEVNIIIVEQNDACVYLLKDIEKNVNDRIRIMAKNIMNCNRSYNAYYNTFYKNSKTRKEVERRLREEIKKNCTYKIVDNNKEIKYNQLVISK